MQISPTTDHPKEQFAPFKPQTFSRNPFQNLGTTLTSTTDIATEKFITPLRRSSELSSSSHITLPLKS
jgi:hypothetical protein